LPWFKYVVMEVTTSVPGVKVHLLVNLTVVLNIRPHTVLWQFSSCTWIT